MMKRSTISRSAAGITLVEMLIVLAIVAILTGVALPSLSRMGAFGSDAVEKAGRDTLNMLRTTRMYAITNRTDTALVYSLKLVPDSRGVLEGESDVRQQLVADGIGMARKMTEEELEQYNEQRATPDEDGNTYAPISVDELDNMFVALDNVPEGRLQLLPPESAIWASVDVAGPDADADWRKERFEEQLLARQSSHPSKSQQGLNLVRLYRKFEEEDATTGEIVAYFEPIVPNEIDYQQFVLERPDHAPWRALEEVNIDLANGDDGTDYALNVLFPAHIYRSNGELDPKDETQQVRYEVMVGRSPDASYTKRFMDLEDYYDPDSGNLIGVVAAEDLNNPGTYLDDPNIEDVPLTFERIELNRYTGRIVPVDEPEI